MVYVRNIAKKNQKKRPSMRGELVRLFYTCAGRCFYCRRTTEMPHLLRPNHALTATVDHMVPLCRGGAMKGGNTTLACALCNHLKADASLQDWIEFTVTNPEWWLRFHFKSKNPVKKQARLPPPPSTVPVRYDDPHAQAAFEAVYRNRLYMLRDPDAVCDANQ